MLLGFFRPRLFGFRSLGLAMIVFAAVGFSSEAPR